VVAVWTGTGLEEDRGRAQGDVGVDAEVEEEGDEAVGAEDGVAGAEPVVVGHCDPAAKRKEEKKSAYVLNNTTRCSIRLQLPRNLPKHHHNHKERRRGEISARQGVLDVGVFFLAAERRHADQARHAHGEETQSRKRVAGQYARGDEEAESREHSDDGDDAERTVLLASTIVGCR